MRNTGQADRALARIRRKGTERCEDIGEFIVADIKAFGPYDKKRRPGRESEPHLRDSYYWREDPATGDVIIKCTRPYWAFVEFGTAEHGKGGWRNPGPLGAQPHVRPAIEAAKKHFG